MFLLGVVVGFIGMLFLGWIPVIGPILAGIAGGVIVGGGAGRGLWVGFFAGILGAVLFAIVVAAGVGIFGALLDLPLLGTFLGSSIGLGSIGLIIVVLGLHNGFLGLIGGAVGGAMRK